MWAEADNARSDSLFVGRPITLGRVRLQHVSIPIPAAGAAAARDFYGGLLGLEERDVLPDLDPAGFIWFRAGGDAEVHLMLVDELPPERPHFCLVADDLGELRTRLEAAGVSTHDATLITGRPRFFCRDPFGNLIELVRIVG
jgi:catechol 2,3-dioxygenase-like lactoylglutathione lyase family enzyme